ncbi:CapA family protein [Microbacterium sp. Marseille-Q6965]|uniref:CapA family protein n=1 Tax=Microbacterium sp. Marseille-Q6965 TaxID=2965072 RepID=UPI0021B78B41|nr:CapA family protein [Microbacterium sp. Marseille-Q6965]
MTRVLATGDLVLERADSAPLLAPALGALATADVLIGQLEVPHTEATVSMSTDVPALPAPPSALDGVAAAGFDVLTLAGNHVFDFGGPGIADTRAHCLARGMAVAGAGATLAEAWRPAIVEAEGHRVAVLSVNCVGPRESWAGTDKPGCAYVEVITHYEPRGANPGGPPRVYTFAEPRSLARLTDEVAGLAAGGATVLVALHKGLVHQPVDIAAYEYEVAHAAIDAGAAAVIGHHAHILKGVEVYRRRPIFHGLGNFATVTSALAGDDDDTPERRAWARERRRLFGFEPDPAMPDYPFHPESRHTAIAVMDLDDDGGVTASLIPCWIDDQARPVPLTRADGGERVAEYIRGISRDAALATEYDWAGDRLTIRIEETA